LEISKGKKENKMTTVFDNPDGTMYTAKLLPKNPRAKRPPTKKEYRIVSLLDHPTTPFKNIIIMTKTSMTGCTVDGFGIARKHFPAQIPFPNDISICTTTYETAKFWGADPVQHHLHVFAEGITASLLIFD
jgi:hypothetical protein